MAIFNSYVKLPEATCPLPRADRVVAYESIFYRHLLREDWPQVRRDKW
jgi:hypothetical protein